MPPALGMFAAQVDALLDAGVTEQTIAAITIKARRHARDNPNAIYRDPLSSR